MGIFGKSLAGAGYVVLNIIRVMNIISIVAVIAASAIMLVKTFNNRTFFFFGAVEHVVRIVVCGFLVLTELPLFKGYWTRNWPLFSPQSGFVMLGISMILMGNSTLANLNRQEASAEQIGLAFWRLVIGSGIVIIVMGAVNIVASYVFRSKHLHLTARHVRSAGAVAPHKLEVESSIAAASPKQNRRSKYKSFFLNKKKHDSLPSYNSQVTRSNTNMTQKREVNYTVTTPYGLSTPGKNDPFTHHAGGYPSSPSSKYSVDSPARPDLAHHPAHTGHAGYI